MEERQPTDAAVTLLPLECLDDLHHVGGQVLLGDLHTGGDPGGSGGVLQIGDGLLVSFGRFPAGADLVGHRIHRNHAGAFLGRAGPEEFAHTLSGFGSRQNCRRRAVVQNGVQPTDVSGFGRIE